MTAPDLPTWTVAEDGDLDLTLWCDTTAVIRQHELRPNWMNASAADHYRGLLWSVLTRVLAPDEATVEQLAQTIHAKTCTCPDVDPPSAYIEAVEAVLAALAGTSAQARHTDGDTTGGGEHG